MMRDSRYGEAAAAEVWIVDDDQSIRWVLERALEKEGFPVRSFSSIDAVYDALETASPGVVLPDHLKQRYPDEMTIVLEHQFWDLEVFPDRFRVILKFGGQPYPIVAPFAALTRFYDPSVRFGLQFDALGGAHIATEEVASESQAPAIEEPAAETGTGSAAVVSLDAFRKK